MTETGVALTGVWWRSLTVRLTVLATGVTAVVLLLVLAAVLALFTRQLNDSVRVGLEAQFTEVAALVPTGSTEAVSSEPFVQLFRGGRLVASSSALGAGNPLVSGPTDVTCPTQVNRRQDVRVAARVEPMPLQVLAQCLPDGQVLAVGVSVEPQVEARERLLALLAVAAPILLAMVAITVGRAVHAALAPVDALTRQAAQITAGPDTSRRLPPVPGGDEIARLARTLDQMLSRLAVAFARERAFIDDASHELRTPIAVLRGEIELALSDPHDTEGVEQSLRAALFEAERLSRLAEDLLTLARFGTDTGQPPGRVTDLHELLTETARRMARVGTLALTVDSPRSLSARIEPARLEQILTNLITNAEAAGASTAHLVARAVEPASRVLDDLVHEVVLSVQDDGPGFPPDFLPTAFERFSRADVARTRTTGAGLGLALVHALVAEAGGLVSADNRSRLGGAAVWVRLPAFNTG